MTSVLIGQSDFRDAMNGAPSLIVLDCVAGADTLALAGMTIWRGKSSRNGVLLWRQDEPPPDEMVPLPLAMPGLIAIVVRKADAAAKLVAWSSEVSNIEPPVVLAEQTGQIPGLLAGLLLKSLNEAQMQLGQLHRALAITRMDYEESRVAMASVLRTLGHRPPAALRLVMTRAPAVDGLVSCSVKRRLRLRQMLGISVKEIAAIAFYIHTAQCGSDTLMRVRLIAEESGRVLGSWLLPSDILIEGWMTLDLPNPIVALRESAVIEIQVDLGTCPSSEHSAQLAA